MFPQGLESIWFVPLLHWRSCTEIMNGPCSSLMVSSGHQRQKILQEGNLLCLAGNLPPFPVVRAVKTTRWILSLSIEKRQCALVQQYMPGPQQSSMQDSCTRLLCAHSWGHTVCTQGRRLVQAKASRKPEYFCSLCIYICVGCVWPGNPASFHI